VIRVEKEGSSIQIFWEDVLWKEVEKGLFPRNEFQRLTKCRSLEELEERFFALEEKAAKGVAIRLLSRQALFSLQIQEKLQRKGFSQEAAQHALDFCRHIGSIDDTALASSKCEREMKKGKGFAYAEQKLKRWAPKEKSLLSREQVAELERASLAKILQKKKVDIEALSSMEKQKLFLFLLKRGFKKEHIQECLST
jgi:regulatory protein